MKKRGQIAIELLFSVGLVTIIVLACLFAVYDKKKSLEYEKGLAEKSSECRKVSNAFVFAINNPGMLINLSLKYGVFVKPNLGLVYVGDYVCAIPMAPMAAHASFNLTKGRIVINSSLGVDMQNV
ncbi:MAG: hypothetical protein Q8O89_08640 [Nanoarchaeota archaeon]|nr:hypothetical protein [Nanoarchaeota archaeon]